MEQKKNTFRRLWWLIPLSLLFLAAVGAVLMYLAGSMGISADTDDPAAILAGYDPDSFPGLTLCPDGTVVLELEKADLYRFARDYDLTEPVAVWLRGDRELRSAGFRLSGGAVTVSINRRAAGLLPLSYRARGGAELREGALCLTFREVTLGSRLRLRESQWPALFRQEVRVDLSGTDFAGELLSAELAGSALRLRFAGLTASGSGTLTLDESTAAALRMLGAGADAPALPAEEGTLSAEALCRWAIESGEPFRSMERGMSLCTEDSLPVLWEQSSAMARRWLWAPLHREATARRQELEHTLAERQKPYEKLLLAVREMYRSGALGIAETGFYNPATGERVHPGTLSRLAVTDIDSRIVFLLTRGSEAAPGEMPELLDVPRKNWLTMDKDLDWRADVDLGVLLTTEGEVPILLYRRADGTLVLREVTEELYVSAMVSRPIPQIDLDTLAPVTETGREAGEGFSGAVMAFLKDQ